MALIWETRTFQPEEFSKALIISLIDPEKAMRLAESIQWRRIWNNYEHMIKDLFQRRLTKGTK